MGAKRFRGSRRRENDGRALRCRVDRWGGIFEALGRIGRGSYVSPGELRVTDLREHGIRDYVVATKITH